MGITSLSYMAYALLIIFVYYLIPGKLRWSLLLVASIAYMVISGNAILLLYPVCSIFVAWLCTNRMVTLRAQGSEVAAKQCKQLLWVAILANLGVLIVLKYLNLGVYTYNAFAMRISDEAALLKVLKFAVPVGVSFYTMSILGYIFDVYYEVETAEKNYFKLLAFGTYFPLLISGPIVRYKDLKEELFIGHKLDYKNITFGAQRVLWGFFKVLVISEKLSVVVAEIFNNFENYNGIYIWIGMWTFAFQLYANFSGSMDIIIGISEMFGIRLPENFRQPFFSENIQEFWQRWHITLGAWLKDYILYPLLRTKTFMNLPKRWKDKLGKKKAKQYTTFIAMAVLWFAVGLWHGGAWKYIWGTGLLQCIYIIISELLTPTFKKIKDKLKIDDKAVWFVVFKRIRTFVLISIGLMFFNANSLSDGFRMVGRAFRFGVGVVGAEASERTVLLGLGIGTKDWVIVCFALLIQLIVSMVNERHDIREWLASKNLVLRWAIIYAVIIFVVIFGNYGPGYNAAEFIYQGF